MMLIVFFTARAYAALTMHTFTGTKLSGVIGPERGDTGQPEGEIWTRAYPFCTISMCNDLTWGRQSYRTCSVRQR